MVIGNFILTNHARKRFKQRHKDLTLSEELKELSPIGKKRREEINSRLSKRHRSKKSTMLVSKREVVFVCTKQKTRLKVITIMEYSTAQESQIDALIMRELEKSMETPDNQLETVLKANEKYNRLTNLLSMGLSDKYQLTFDKLLSEEAVLKKHLVTSLELSLQATRLTRLQPECARQPMLEEKLRSLLSANSERLLIKQELDQKPRNKDEVRKALTERRDFEVSTQVLINKSSSVYCISLRDAYKQKTRPEHIKIVKSYLVNFTQTINLDTESSVRALKDQIKGLTMVKKGVGDALWLQAIKDRMTSLLVVAKYYKRRRVYEDLKKDWTETFPHLRSLDESGLSSLITIQTPQTTHYGENGLLDIVKSHVGRMKKSERSFERVVVPIRTGKLITENPKVRDFLIAETIQHKLHEKRNPKRLPDGLDLMLKEQVSSETLSSIISLVDQLVDVVGQNESFGSSTVRENLDGIAAIASLTNLNENQRSKLNGAKQIFELFEERLSIFSSHQVRMSDFYPPQQQQPL